TRTKIRCGRTSASLKSGVPHAGQNFRCMRLPLSAMLTQSVVLPATLNVAVRKQALTVPLPAPRYWHSRHQHQRVTIGGSGLSQRTAPQKHLPVTVIAPSDVMEGLHYGTVGAPGAAARLVGVLGRGYASPVRLPGPRGER